MPGPEALVLEESVAWATADRAVVDLIKSETWKPALAGATHGTALLVQRLDQIDDYYFIVPYLKDAVVTARLVVDARTHDVEEIGAIEKAGQTLPTFSEPSVVLSQLARQQPGPTWIRFRIRPELTCRHPTLLWKSCIESRSKLRPFYLFTVGDQPVYVRVDGQAFPTLRELPDA